jgi:hypothetical protein
MRISLKWFFGFKAMADSRERGRELTDFTVRKKGNRGEGIPRQRFCANSRIGLD